jgi:hypothetical protein
MQVRTVLDAAQLIGTYLGVRYGDVTLSFSDGGVTLLRRGETFKPEDLAEMLLYSGVESDQ